MKHGARLVALVVLLAGLMLPSPVNAAGREAPDHLPDRGQRWVFVGDSLTRGFRVEQAEAFPNEFDRMTPHLWTVNLGRSGSCLVSAGCYAWQPWVDVFEDVAYSGTRRVDRIVVLLGTNDLCRADVTVDKMVAGYQRLGELAAAHGTPITFLTLLPQAPPRVECEDRQAVNDWLLNESGLDVVDVTTPLADGAGLLRPEYDSGDGLHINAAGQQVVAQTLSTWARSSGALAR